MARKIYSWFLVFLSIGVVYFTYRNFFDISPTAIIIVVFMVILYYLCLRFSQKSMKELKELEIKQTHTELEKADYSKALMCSLGSLLPTYYCVIIVSMIPFYNFDSWYITGFPCLVLISMPAKAVLDVYRDITLKKLPLVSLFILIIISLYISGQLIISALI